MTSTDAPDVVVEGLRASYDRRVLTTLSFTAAAGKTTTVLGASGSGKTTLVRVLLGRLTPEGGEVRVGDRAMAGAGAGGLTDAHRHTRYLFSGLSAGSAGRKGPDYGGVADPDDGVVPKASVGKNLRSAAVDSGADDRVQEWLTTFDLADQEQRPAGELGAGARRRLGLARVFVSDPPLVVLDDPVAGLDPTERDEVIAALLRARAASPATIIVTCCDVTTAKAVSDHVVVLIAGRARRQGTPDLVLRLIKSDDDYAAQFAMGGKITDRSTSSLATYRMLGRFRGYDQEVLMACIALVGLICLIGIVLLGTLLLS